eukprot:3939080-Rhodomonas_salina.1
MCVLCVCAVCVCCVCVCVCGCVPGVETEQCTRANSGNATSSTAAARNDPQLSARCSGVAPRTVQISSRSPPLAGASCSSSAFCAPPPSSPPPFAPPPPASKPAPGRARAWIAMRKLQSEREPAPQPQPDQQRAPTL